MFGTLFVVLLHLSTMADTVDSSPHSRTVRSPDLCKGHTCPRGEICIMREVQCITTPCDPQPGCTSAVTCLLAPDTGMCEAAIPRWYYDASESKCLQFTYGGCGGNANNFLTRNECKRACHNYDKDLTMCEKRRLENSDPNLMDARMVDCDKDGNFVKKQCDGFMGACFCVTVVEGNMIPGSWVDEDEGLAELDCEADEFKQYYRYVE